MPNQSGDQSFDLRLALLKSQVDRIVDDLDLEKTARVQENKEIINRFEMHNAKIDTLSKHVYVGVGILVALQFVAPMLWRFLSK